MRKLLPFFSLLFSLNTYASDTEIVSDENTPPVYTNSHTLGIIALKLSQGKSDYPKYLSCFKEIAQAGHMSTKDALKITLLLEEMGDEKKAEIMIAKLTRRPICPEVKNSLEYFSKELLKKPTAFEELKRKIIEARNPLYTSPGSDEDDFYNSKTRKKKRVRFTSPQFQRKKLDLSEEE